MIHFSKRARPSQPSFPREHNPGSELYGLKPYSQQFDGTGATLGVDYRGQQFTGGKTKGPALSSKSLLAQPRDNNEDFVTERGAAGNFTFRDQVPQLQGQGTQPSGVAFQASQAAAIDWKARTDAKPKATPPPEKTGLPNTMRNLLPGVTA